MRGANHRNCRTPSEDQSAKADVVVGFDSEWVDASHADDGIRPNASNRILSWQLYLVSSSGACALLVEAKGGDKSSRRGLKPLLGMVVRKAIREGIIPSPPDVIHLAAHFSRADLSTLRDFAKLKRRFSAVRRTYATTMKPLVLGILTDEGPARVSVRLVDTMLIAPTGASLALLGATLGVPKVDLPQGYSKARMDVFKQQKPEEFARYALADAEIAARWAVRVFSLVRAEMGVSRSFPTLGSVGVAMIEDEITRLGTDVNAFFGREKRLRGSTFATAYSCWQIGICRSMLSWRSQRSIRSWLLPGRTRGVRSRSVRRLHDRHGADKRTELANGAVHKFPVRAYDNRRACVRTRSVLLSK